MKKEERLTKECWRNLDPWECCGQDFYCKRGLREKGGCINGCIVPRNYRRLAKYEDTGLSPAEIKELQEKLEELNRVIGNVPKERLGELFDMEGFCILLQDMFTEIEECDDIAYKTGYKQALININSSFRQFCKKEC